ncbi:MAG: MOSC domain-containing protein [Acidimicrobiales bacterium]|nr:MOSC domain-containing protein [Acidimicrobiales bacterium]
MATHRSTTELEAGLEQIRRSPRSVGTVELIVRRPAVDEREVISEGELRLDTGLVGDSWLERGSTRTADGAAHPDMQLNVMNARVIALLAPEPHRWALAGDQLYVDLDLSEANLPAGTRLRLGSAVIEVTAEPHRGCAKFAARFGPDALRFVNSDVGRQLRLRGLNAKVVQPGRLHRGDAIARL